MWKRLPLRDRGNKGRQSLQIGAPTLVESTYDVHQLDRAQNLSPIEEPALSPGEAYYNADTRPSRARQDAETKLKLPTMNFGKQNPNDPTSYRPSIAASSVYSQPDDNISPPASPYRRPALDDGRISPIEEQHSPSGYGDLSRPNKSQIPVARKITPRSKEWTQNVGKGAPMMWDDYSGEPTFDGAGKPSQVKPGEFDYRSGLKPTNKLPRPSAPSSSQAQKTSFREKASRLAKQGLAVDTRPPWKGGSGRHAIVDTPQDKPGQAPPQPKRVEEKRLKSPGADSINTRTPSPNAAHTPETHVVAGSYPAQGYPEDRASDIDPRNNVSSGRREYDSPAPDAGPSPHQYSDPNEYPSPLPDRNATPTNEYPYSAGATIDPSIGTHPALRDNRVQPLYADDSPSRNGRNNPHSKLVQESPEPNTGSRFSWTTTATSTYQQSIPPSPPPPMPTKYMNADSPASVKASVLDRGHPTRRLGTESPPMSARSFSAGSTLRKPVSSLAVQPPSPEPPVIKQQFPLTDWRTGVPKQRASSLAPSILSTTSSGGKSLPKTPQELTSPDLIASLQAQQADLSLQRRNIQRLIADLEKPEAKNPVLHSFKVIREREKQLESLKGELADVIRRDHDLGMRLHRAWKRKERDDPNTPGSIFWVRRATAGT